MDVRQLTTGEREGSRRRPFQSLSTRFTAFTGVLLLWVVAATLAYDLYQGTLSATKALLECGVVLAVAAVISLFTIRVLGRPLRYLQQGITAVRKGKLEQIQVSRTGDEIEYLGESFNQMIDALTSSQGEIRRHQELLEQRIRQRTEELEEAMLRAQAANEAKSEFLANMSHELRTPMAGILGMLDVTLESELPEEHRDQLETAQRCAYSLLALLNDILDLSKIESGRMGLEQIPFDIRIVLQDCVRSFQPRADESGIDLVCQVSPAVPEEVAGDPLRLRQIFANLLSNAIKFTQQGHVRVTLDATPAKGGEIQIRFVVEDTGIGIPPEKLPLIFEKFTQVDGSVSRKFGGTGLGLAITRKLVEMHHGEITVESEPDKGSTFTVNFRCTVPQPAPENAPASAAGRDAKESREGAPVRVLVVEDNHVNQKVVTTVLRKRGFAVVLANNGVEALELLEHDDRYGLVIMDVQMPVMDGLEATRRIRLNPKWQKLPILAMTAHAMNGDREKCLSAGMNGYISKPVHPSHLLSIMDEYMSPVEVTGSGV
jgi:signal transduction histidine kinase/ActR/RegA family two-component response regulator